MEFIQDSPFSEGVARYYFIQLAQAIEHVHQIGIAHRDIRPENILLDDKYTLKLADFGSTGPIAGRDGSGTLKT